MYTISHAIPVNPEGEDCILAQEDVWAGLVTKAENALPFVPGMSKCEVVDRGTENGQDWLLRDVAFKGQEFQERILLRAPTQVHFTRVGGGGFIENTISTSDQGLQLAFTFGLVFPGTEAGSAGEREKGESMKGDYIGAVAATLAKVREMKRAGELSQAA